MSLLSRLLLSLCLVALAGCGGGSPSPSPRALPSWTRPADPMGLARQAGLTPDTKEYVDYHEHAHLDVFVDGLRVTIPGGIGIETSDPAVIQFSPENFAGIPEEGCAQICISPMHTHDADGVIHLEAKTEAKFTLGQFFKELAVRLDAACVDRYCAPDTEVVVYLDGQKQSGNPADVVLRGNQEIAIVIGTPPTTIPDSFSGEG